MIDTDFPLTESSIVFDLGAHKGSNSTYWFSDIHRKYHCEVHAFEPYFMTETEAEARSLGDKVSFHPFGLGGRSRRSFLYPSGDGTSFVAGTSSPVEAQIVSFTEFLASHPTIQSISLAKINIEGMEYELLDSIIEAGLTPRLQHLLIQYHALVPLWGHRHMVIAEALLQTHKIVYSDPLKWERWEPR